MDGMMCGDPVRHLEQNDVSLWVRLFSHIYAPEGSQIGARDTNVLIEIFPRRIQY